MILEQQLKNTKIALRRWMEVPPENVIPGLHKWTSEHYKNPDCGTLACFGGWLSVMPEFVKMGVKRTVIGSPYMDKVYPMEYPYSNARLLGKYLFGNSTIFNSRGRERTKITDHQAVQNRLNNNIKRIEKRINSKLLRKS